MNKIYDGALGSSSVNPQIGMGLKQILEKKEGLFRMNMMVLSFVSFFVFLSAVVFCYLLLMN